MQFAFRNMDKLNDMAHTYSQALDPYVVTMQDDDKITKYCILITGFIISFWTYSIFLVGCTPDGLQGNGVTIALTALVTHIIISLSVTSSVKYGLKHKRPAYLKPWIVIKIIEGILLFTGSILCATQYYRRNVGLTPVGMLLLLVNFYVILCVYNTYKKLLPTPDKAPQNTEHIIPEHPPAYDSFTNQNDNM